MPKYSCDFPHSSKYIPGNVLIRMYTAFPSQTIYFFVCPLPEAKLK